jgi:hypothetical protein
MDEIWGFEDFHIFFAKNKKKKNKGKSRKLPYIDPAHEFTDYPERWQISPEDFKNFGQCQNCGVYEVGVKDPNNYNLCQQCNKNDFIKSRYANQCDHCGKKAEPGQKYCPMHTQHCETCNKLIDDIGEPLSSPLSYVVDRNVYHCKNHRKRCEDCEDYIHDQEEFPDSKVCQNCRSLCNDCGKELTEEERDSYKEDIPNSEKYCSDHQNTCAVCDKLIQDQADWSIYGDESNYCKDHRKECLECPRLIDDLEDLQDPEEEEYCSDHRKNCAECDEPIRDRQDFPDSDYCEEHRSFCKVCYEELRSDDKELTNMQDHCDQHVPRCNVCDEPIADCDEHPESEHCEEHRNYCRDCSKEIGDIGLPQYEQLVHSNEQDARGIPLKDYCGDCRHRCKFCANPIKDYQEEKAKYEQGQVPAVSIQKAVEIGTHPNDLSSMQYKDVKNPEFGKQTGQDWYNMCSDCRDYIRNVWK